MTFKIIFRLIVILLTGVQISFLAHASKGIILTYDGKLNLYENDKFIKQINYFDDTNIKILFTGDYYYVSKFDYKTKKYYLEKWNIDKNTLQIIKPNSTFSPISEMSFLSKGSGFILTQDGNLDYYLNDLFINNKISQSIEDYQFWGPISFSGTSLYKTLISHADSHSFYSSLFKCSKAGKYCYSMEFFGGERIDLLSFNQNDNGYLVTHNIHNAEPILYKFANDKIVGIVYYDYKFDTSKSVLSVTNDSIYFLSYSKHGKVITKCDIDGINCVDLNIPDKNFKFASFK